MTDERVVKIAKLRAKAQSTAYPAEAATFRRKALILMEKHGIGEEAVQRALAEIFGGRREQRASSASGPTADRRRTRQHRRSRRMGNRRAGQPPMRAREIWALIQERGLYMRSRGRTPWATVASKLSTDPQFERVAPGLYRLQR